MRRRTALGWLLTSTLAIAGCQSLRVEAAFRSPTELTATAVATSRVGNLGRLAFIQGGDLWVKDLPDGVAQRLTQDGHNESPLWSVSGDWIAYHQPIAGTFLAEAWVVSRQGRDARKVDLVDVGSGFPVPTLAWSPRPPDRLAYVHQGGLAVVHADGSDRREIVSPPDKGPGPRVRGIAWSPDTEWLAVQRDEDVLATATNGPPFPRPAVRALWLMRPDASGGQEVLHRADPSEEWLLLGWWSPDGAGLLYWLLPQLGMSILADGVPLYRIGATGGASFQVSPRMLAHPDFLAWAPDGQRLALVDGGLRECWDEKAITLATPDQVSRRLSAPGRADLFPAWSPDGNVIAYTSGPETHVVGGESARQALAARRIWAMAPDGTNPHPLTADPTARDERPQWSTDGKTLLFARFRGEQAQLWLVDADGTNPRQVVSELTPTPDIFGYYGYVDWARLYDWWKGPPAASLPAAATPSTTRSPTAISPPTPTHATDPLDAYLDRSRAYLESTDGRAVTASVAAAHLRDLAIQPHVVLEYLTTSDGGQVDAWIGRLDAGNAFMLWRDGLMVRAEVWTNRDPPFYTYLVNPVRAFRLDRQNGFLEMGLIPANIGSTADAIFVLARLVAGRWQEVWSPFPSAKDSWGSSGGRVDFAGPGIDVLHLAGPIPPDVPASRVFDEFGVALKQEYVSDWQRQGDNFVRVGGKIVPTPFTALATFIDDLQRGNRVAATAWAINSTIVDRARQLGLDRPASGRGWWATNQSTANGLVTITFFDNADRRRHFAVGLAEVNGTWRVKAIDALPPAKP